MTSIPGPDSIVRREFPNGMTVLVRENFSSPSVVIDGLLRAGAVDEPAEQAGLASFAGVVLDARDGAPQLSADLRRDRIHRRVGGRGRRTQHERLWGQITGRRHANGD